MNTTRKRIPLMLALTLCLIGFSVQPTSAYQLGEKWTPGSGATGALGAPVLTWSIVPDATYIGMPFSNSASSLVSFFDENFGSSTGDLRSRPWFEHFNAVFDRWSELSGVTYVYEPDDDGTTIGMFQGVLGVRGDIRIAATPMDGLGGLVGLSTFPLSGDMVLDTDEQARFMNPEYDYNGLRSVIAHEHGHTLGLRHVESSDAKFLMEVNVLPSVDGPQLDDIRGIHRAYGDALEKSNDGQGNNTFANATPLGVVQSGTLYSIGNDADDTVVEPHETDFVSIDDTLDLDFFSFEVLSDGEVSLVLEPMGPTYLEGPGNGIERQINSQEISDLTLTLFDSNMNFLTTANTAGLGETESITGFSLPGPGTYFARVTGTANDVQLYRISLTTTAVPEPAAGLLCYLLGLLLTGLLQRPDVSALTGPAENVTQNSGHSESL
jgi:hypothetical protein